MDWVPTYVRLWRLLLERWRLLAIALVGMIGAAIATAAFATLTGPCLRLLFSADADPVWLGGRLGSFVRSLPADRVRLALPLCLFGVTVVRSAFGYLQNSRMAALCLRTVAELQERLHRRILELPLSFFEGRHSGEVYSRFASDLGHVERALSQGLAYSLRDVCQIGALVSVCLVLDARLFVIAGLTLPIGVFAIVRFGAGLRAISQVMQERQARLLARIQDVISGATVLRIYRAEAATLRSVGQVEDTLLADGRRSAFLRAAVTPTIELLAFAGAALVLASLSMHWIALPPEKVVSFFGAILLAYQPLKSLATNGQWMVPGLTAAERLFALLDEAPAIADAPNARHLPENGAGNLELRQVTVRYGERAVLCDIDLRIAAGERVAVVGRSGAGKSTLLHLIPRLLDATEGQVQLSRVPVAEATLKSLRAQVALVGQEVFLFDASVAENLQTGSSKVSMEDLERALEAAGALNFVQALPQGLNTRLGERGLTLSGGQRQRLSLARALVKPASVLLLDEAMSALDPPLEAELLARLTAPAIPGRAQPTLVVVTHRLASAALLDRVVVLEGGRIVEDGPPAPLLAQDGWFARAHAEQAGAAA